MEELSRRSFVVRSAGWIAPSLGLILAGAHGCQDAGTDPPSAPNRQKIIDVHIHTNFQDEVTRGRAEHLSGVDFSARDLLAEMAANNVEQALSIGFESEDSELSRQAENPMGLNHLLPGKVFLIGGINPYRLDREGLSRIERALREKKLKGLKIYLGYYHKPPGDEAYQPVYELAGRYQVPVMLHTGDTYSENAKLRYAHPLLIDDIAVDYRDVTFVLAHLGNPWTLDCAELMYKNPNVYGDLSGFLVGDEGYFRDPKNVEGIQDVIERIREAFAWVENPKKFLYGSDWPLVPMRSYLELIKKAIDPGYHPQIFYSNAKEVFRLP